MPPQWDESAVTEDDLIAALFAPIAGEGALGLRDDAALIAPTPGREIVVTLDTVVAGIHFFADDPPGAIARKALRVNLSDLAAKGALPRGFLLSLSLPKDFWAGAGAQGWLETFARTLGEDARRYGCPLLGGDTVATPGPLTLSITALGEVAAGRMVKRTGVKPGDALYVTGTIGDGALGLKARMGETPRLTGADEDFLVGRYLTPEPRNALARAMADFASGGMDVSDGLVGDLSKMLRVSGVAARVDLRAVPLSPSARALIAHGPEWFERAMTGGDDYELLASLPPGRAAAFEAAAAEANVAVTRVGEALAGAGAPTFIGLDGAPATFKVGSYGHF